MTATRIAGATALAGKDLRPIEDALVIVEGERIAAVEAAGGNAPPDGGVVDASGLLLLPGFIDAHVHMGFADPLSVLAGGVTTVRDLAWPPEKIWPLVAASKAATFEGPEVLAAGQMLTVKGGYPTRARWAPPNTGRVVADEADAVVAVNEQADAGACVIKVGLNAAAGPTLARATLTTIVSAASDRNLGVTAHVTGLNELEKALEAGVDEHAHMLMGAEPIPDGVIGRMVSAGVCVVPTLACRFGRELDVAVDNLHRYLTAGGRVIYGTDLGNEGPQPGIDAGEIGAIARAGMDASAIVKCATVDAAAHLGLVDRGSLSVGQVADIIALDSRAAHDPRALSEVVMVWRRGRLAVDRRRA